MTILSTAVLMSSCGLYSKFKAPEAQVDNSIIRGYDELGIVADSVSFADVAWREVFTDPQLQVLIEKGLENNVDVHAAAVNVQKLEEALKCARLAFLPSVTFTPDASLSNVFAGEMRSKAWKRNYAMPITAKWSADIFGKILATKRGAEMSLEMVKDYEQAARSGIICGVANMYYTLLMLDRQLEILQDMEKLTKSTWEMMKLQKDLRGARETAVVSAEAAHLNVQSNIIDMKRQIMELENALSLLINQQAQSIKRGKLEDQTLPEKFSTGCAVGVLSNRPDVHAALMNLAACFYDIEVARSAFFPGLNITATGSFTNGLGGAVVNPGNWLANFAASLTQPVFQNGRLRYQLKVAKLEYELAEKEWEHALLNAGAEVSNALILYNSSKDKADIDRQQVAVLEKSVAYTQELFKMGGSSYLEVISAQSNLLNAEISAVGDNFDKMQAVVNLYSALGGGRK